MTVKELFEKFQNLITIGYGEMDVCIHERYPSYALAVDRIEVAYECEGEIIDKDEYEESEEKSDFIKCVIIYGE
jgi:hypothetical protein